MTKITWKPGTMLSPVPPAMISCGTVEKPNVMTVAWTGIINSEPPMTYVSIRPSRYSHELIKESGEFVINLTTLPLVTAADFCGVKSGREIDKFKEMNLTATPCTEISAPQIAESPVSMECKVKDVVSYGTHDMFIAEIVSVNVDDKFIDEKGRLDLEKAGIIAYSHGNYYTLGRNLGNFGFSVNKARLKQMQKMEKVTVEVKETKIISNLDELPERKTTKTFDERKRSSTTSRGKSSGRSYRDDDRPRRSFNDGEDRPRRSFNDGERKPREFNRDDRPRRSFNEGEDRPRRSFNDGERKPREFNRDDRPRRSFNEGEDRPRRSFNDGERKPREFNRDDRPRRSFNDGEDRPRRSFNDGERKPREFNRDDRPRRSFNDGEDRPRRSFNDGERKPREFNRDDRKEHSDDKAPRKHYGKSAKKD